MPTSVIYLQRINIKKQFRLIHKITTLNRKYFIIIKSIESENPHNNNHPRGWRPPEHYCYMARRGLRGTLRREARAFLAAHSDICWLRCLNFVLNDMVKNVSFMIPHVFSQSNFIFLKKRFRSKFLFH